MAYRLTSITAYMERLFGARVAAHPFDSRLLELVARSQINPLNTVEDPFADSVSGRTERSDASR